MQSRPLSHGPPCRTPDIGEVFPFHSPEQRRLRHVLSAVEELTEANMGKGILLWLIGVPIPVIILLWLFFGH